MNNHRTILCVGIPTFEEVGKLVRGFNDTLAFLETCAFLQQKLAGIWEISHTGEAQKQTLDASWTNTGQCLYVDIGASALVIAQLRIHYQYLDMNHPSTTWRSPVAEFDVRGYPDNSLKRFLIGARQVDDKFVPTYTFR